MKRWIALLPLLAATASADTVVIEPSKDNTLYDEGSGALSNGTGDTFFSGLTGEPRVVRGLLEFDVAGSLPAGSTITDATLTLYMSAASVSNPFTPNTVAAHRALAEWGEGSSQAPQGGGQGGPSSSGDATWIHTFYPSSFWSTAGGDHVPAASASLLVPVSPGHYSWNASQLTSDVQLFLDQPGDNHGWILVGTETANSRRFDSRSHPTPANHPILTIEFTPPVTTTGACCATDGSCSVVLDPGGSCGGTYQGLGSVCSPNTCPQPTGACCIPDAAATCNELTDAACTLAGGTFQGSATTCGATECPVIPTPFVDVMPVPSVAVPVSGSPGGVATYDIAMREVQQTLHSELPATTLWAYGDGPSGASFPGPTIEATSDQTVTVNWINDLRDSAAGGSPKPLRTDHLLPVDLCPHGAEDSAKTVVHLHGTHTTADSDGHPEDTFDPGQQDTYVYPNQQLPSALWYHDHALGQTRLNVYLGLAGMYLIRDATENALALPSGANELPLVIADRSFNPDGSLEYPTTVQEVFFGETLLVNGRVWPRYDVDQGKYRFRVLNASNSRHLTLEFCPSDTSPCPTPVSFQLLGEDGGLLPAPVPLTQLTLGPAERADLVMDFAPYPAATEIFLVNSAPAPFPGSVGVGVVPRVMRFDVQGTPGFTTAVPASLRSMEVLDEQDAIEHREFELLKGPGDQCSPFMWEIVSLDASGDPAGSMWTDLVEFPELGTTEVWKFINRSGMTHPMHMHLVFFQVLDRQNFDVVDDEVVPIGSPTPPAPEEAGWKDTVQVGPNEMVRVIARFEDYTGLFPYHCHILEHEDHEMMRQFQTISCGNDDLEPTEECDDGNTLPGDGCSSDCENEDDASIYGIAAGGDVTITVDGVVVVVPTTGGQTAEQVASAVAAALTADPTLSSAGVTSFADGNRIVTTGAIDSLVLNDAGLGLAAPIPTLPPLALALFVGTMGLALVTSVRRLGRSSTG
jgi:spore coat protein A